MNKLEIFNKTISDINYLVELGNKHNFEYNSIIKKYDNVSRLMIHNNVHRLIKLKLINRKKLEEFIICVGGLCNFNIDQLKTKLNIMNNSIFSNSQLKSFFANFKGVTKETIWKWFGTVGSDGYGRFSHAQSNLSNRPHRIIYELTISNIPKDFFVCHSCDCPLCCNIFHLWTGTANDNNQDMKNKNRQATINNGRKQNYILDANKFDKIIDDIKQDKYKIRQDIVNDYNNFTLYYITGKLNGKAFNSNKYTLKDVKKISSIHLSYQKNGVSSNIKDLIFIKILNQELETLNQILK